VVRIFQASNRELEWQFGMQSTLSLISQLHTSSGHCLRVHFWQGCPARFVSTLSYFSIFTVAKTRMPGYRGLKPQISCASDLTSIMHISYTKVVICIYLALSPRCKCISLGSYELRAYALFVLGASTLISTSSCTQVVSIKVDSCSFQFRRTFQRSTLDLIGYRSKIEYENV
jgi:hypothetical protein